MFFFICQHSTIHIKYFCWEMISKLWILQNVKQTTEIEKFFSVPDVYLY